MLFSDFERVKAFFKGKRVALFGSAPTCLDNDGRMIDAFDIIVRTNNYRMKGEKHGVKYDYTDKVGGRTDVFYSFFGSSIRKTRDELMKDGVKLCMSKLPNSKPIESEWHVKHGKLEGIDYRANYRRRESFWFCPTYVPTDGDFIKKFEYLGNHQPTTGFSAICDLMKSEPKELYISGFDFFTSGVHNVNERWRLKNPSDPLKHLPELEAEKLKELSGIYKWLTLDKYLKDN